MIETISQYGVRMKEPSIHEAWVTFLKKKLELTKDLIKDHPRECKRSRCFIMSDGWTDRKENFY